MGPHRLMAKLPRDGGNRREGLMTATIDFYFDFISPFSYLAQLRLPEIARRHGRALAYHPIDIPEAKIAAGNYGPSNREVPAKIKVLTADLQRLGRRYDVPLTFPRSEERRVGERCGSTCRSWWSPIP